jgi:hypothetical protein
MIDPTDITFTALSDDAQPDWLFMGDRLFKRVGNEWLEVPYEEWPQPCCCEECKEAFAEME